MILQNKKTGRLYELSPATWAGMSIDQKRKYKQVAEGSMQKPKINPPEEITIHMTERMAQVEQEYPKPESEIEQPPKKAGRPKTNNH